MIVEHAGVALVVVAVVVVMSGWNAQVSGLRAGRPLIVVRARSQLSAAAEDVVDHEFGTWRLDHRSAALHLHWDGHPGDLRQGTYLRGDEWAVVAH